MPDDPAANLGREPGDDGTDAPTLLVTVDGRDRPGLMTAVLDALADGGGEVLDVEQIVLRGRLVLGILVRAAGDDPAYAAGWRDRLAALGTQLGVEIEVESGAGDNPSRRAGRSHVTVIGAPLDATALAGLTGVIAGTGANVDRILRIARYPVTAIELTVSGVPTDELRVLLGTAGRTYGVDVAVQPGGLARQAKRLVVTDVDSTLVQGEVIEMLAAHAGRAAEVAAVTARAMAGELDFADSLRQRVSELAGLSVGVLDETYAQISLAPGARTMVRTLKRLGYQVGIVSGGFSQITDRIAADLGIDFAEANTLEVADGKLTGRVSGPIVDRAGKAAALRRFADAAGIPLSQTVAIGDGANDLDMLAAAGLGIAYNAKPVVADAADTRLSVPYLDTILYLLGVTREDLEAADAASGFPTPAPPLP